MVIDAKLIKAMFGAGSLFKLFLGLFVIITIVGIVLYMSCTNRYNIESARIYHMLSLEVQNDNSPDVIYGVDKEDMISIVNRCSSIHCVAVFIYTTNKTILIKMNDTSQPTIRTMLDPVNISYHPLSFRTHSINGELFIRYNNQTYVVDDHEYFTNIINIMFIALGMLTSGFLLIFFYIQYIRYKNNLYEKGTYKMYVENKLQRDVTEMIHHEMNMPIAVIRTTIEDLQESLECSKCITRTGTKANRFETIELAIQRIESVLYLLQEAKHIKYNYKEISIYKILENIIACVNSFSLNKIKVDYLNKEIMESHTIAKSLSSGTLLNVINVMVTNSKEAKALNIRFDAQLRKSGYMHLYMEDDGIGIRDKTGKIIKTDSIFDWGYSSKDMNGNNIVNKNIFIRFLSKIGIRFTEKTTSRGVGLYVNRSVLRKVGGDIKLMDTSESGTRFLLIIPITEFKS